MEKIKSYANISNPFKDPWIVRVVRNPEGLPISELLAVPKEEDDEFEDSKWSNRDLIPTPKDRHTWTSISYFGYWAVAGMGIPTWSMGSSALSYGLNCQQALVAIAVGALIVGILAVLIGVIGQKHRIGYTVSSRAAFGFYGCYLPIAIKSFVACLWQGQHIYYIGQGLAGTIGSLAPQALKGSLNDPFSDWSPLTGLELIGVFIGVILFCFVMLIPPEKMQPLVHISFILQCGSFFGLFAWSLHINGGKLGPLWTEQKPVTTVNFNSVWGVFYMISNVCGSNSGVLGQSDWTRYSKTRYAPNFSQIITAPVTLFGTASLGIFASAAMEPVLGTIYWNPVVLLPRVIQYYDYNSASRAAIFFASFGIISGQLWQAVLLTACSTGMDIAGFSPKYINIRRGSYVMTLIGIACQPWKLLTNASVFLTVLSGFSVFIGPLVGCALADYFLVRKMKYRLCDLYRTENSIYNYKYGINWRGIASISIGFLPTLPGLICSAGGYHMAEGYVKFYNLTYMFGLLTTMVAHVIINHFFPPAGLGLEAPFMETVEVFDAAEGSESDKGKGDYIVDEKLVEA
jgi:NCS1 family nucleobase:cation symporter-1